MSVSFDINTAAVANLRDRLNETKQAGGNAASGLKDAESASQSMNRQMAALVGAQRDINDLLRNGTINTNSYSDSLLKVATAGAAAVVAYRGMSDAIGLVNRGMQEQISIMDRARSGLVDLVSYGGNSFSLMTAGAVTAQKAIAQIGEAIGSTGAQFAAFVQRTATLGASPQSVQGSFGTLAYSLSHPSSTQGALAGQTLAAYGISPSGSPDDVAAKFLEALRKVQPGAERTQSAENVFGPGGADLIKDTIAGIATVSDKERELQQLRESNAQAEMAAAEARRKSDEASVAYYEQHPVRSLLWGGAFSDATNARTANSVNEALFGQHLTAAGNQMLGRAPGGFMAGLSNLGATLNPWGTPQFPNNGLDYRPRAPLTPTDFYEGAGDLGGAGVMSPQAAQLGYANAIAKLGDDLDKGKIQVEQFDAATANLTTHMLGLYDKVGPLVTSAQNTGSLYGFAPGYQRGRENFLRQGGAANATAAGVSPERLALMSPDQIKSYLSDSDRASLTGAFTSQYQMQGLDAVIAQRGQTNVAGAEAGAAGHGGIASLRARIAAETAYKNSLDDGANAVNNAAEAILKLNAGLFGFVAAGNAAVGRGAGAAARLIATPSPIHGTTGPQGLLASAQFSAAQTLGYGPTDMAAPTNPVTQANTLEQANSLGQRANEVMARMQVMTDIELQRASTATASDGGARGTMQLRQQTGLTQLKLEIDDTIAAMKAEGSTRTDVMDALRAKYKAAEDALTGLSDAAKTTRTAMADAEVRKQQDALRSAVNSIQGGGSAEDAAIANKSASLKASGASNPDQQAKTLVEMESTYKDLKSNQEEWNKSISRRHQRHCERL